MKHRLILEGMKHRLILTPHRRLSGISNYFFGPDGWAQARNQEFGLGEGPKLVIIFW